MKKIIAALALTTGYISVMAQEHTVQITPVVQSAVVYLDGAELYHTKQIALNAGRTLITFNGVSSKLISKSIQVASIYPRNKNIDVKKYRTTTRAKF
ncbi:MAG: DUF4140 domain-containing protein [Bacteroidia bacterium]